jgi:hypothetical protein
MVYKEAVAAQLKALAHYYFWVVKETHAKPRSRQTVSRPRYEPDTSGIQA